MDDEEYVEERNKKRSERDTQQSNTVMRRSAALTYPANTSKASEGKE
jgi:hypothetical protein